MTSFPDLASLSIGFFWKLRSAPEQSIIALSMNGILVAHPSYTDMPFIVGAQQIHMFHATSTFSGSLATFRAFDTHHLSEAVTKLNPL